MRAKRASKHIRGIKGKELPPLGAEHPEGELA